MRASGAGTVWAHLHRCGHLPRVSVVGVGRDLLLLSPPSGVVYLPLLLILRLLLLLLVIFLLPLLPVPIRK